MVFLIKLAFLNNNHGGILLKHSNQKVCEGWGSFLKVGPFSHLFTKCFVLKAFLAMSIRSYLECERPYKAGLSRVNPGTTNTFFFYIHTNEDIL